MALKNVHITLFLAVAIPMMAMAENSIEKDSDDYTLVWHDEFNDSLLDEQAWNIEVNGNGGNNAELQYYQRANVSFSKEQNEGCLVLTARKQVSNGKSFTSGRINSEQKVFFTYGKIESHIKMPVTANGLWPAFWLLGSNYSDVGWPRCGEIDIIEMGNAEGIKSGSQAYYFNGACHWGYYNDKGQYPNYALHSVCPYSIEDGEFHLFTVEWTDKTIKMYLDRDKNPHVKPYFQLGVEDASNQWSTGRYFRHDFFLVYDLAVGGYFTGILKPDGISALDNGDARMYIDYVRVYQKSSAQNIIMPTKTN
jgi:beta-glucanase (GH16 family)